MKKLQSKYLKDAIEEREYSLIHLGFQNEYLATENGQKAKGSEQANEIIKRNEIQIEQINRELEFFKNKI